ncbi:MAG: hypothetical protein KKB78_04965, partial [Alphaproteobacteria bacterium]|nr:hypothetical protein [Alphaproteobacteria bacterium]
MQRFIDTMRWGVAGGAGARLVEAADSAPTTATDTAAAHAKRRIDAINAPRLAASCNDHCSCLASHPDGAADLHR